MHDVWTSSRLGAFLRCPRMHHNRYVLEIDEGGGDAARFGAVGHGALETWLRHRGQGDELDLAVDACDRLPDAYDAAKLRALVLGYGLRWASVRWRVLEVEVEFAFQLDGHLVAGKIDAIVEDVGDDPADRGLWVVEHKFTSIDTSPGAAYWERLTIDRQVSIYVDGAAALGYEVRGVIYDVIARPAHQPARATPVELRKYTVERTTKGKGCLACGGTAGGKNGPRQGTGRGRIPEDYETTPENERPLMCEKCKGTGWAEAPVHHPSRLYADQREDDEKVEDFADRVAAAIAAAPDTYYRRGRIVRLEHELPVMRADLLDTIRLAKIAGLAGLAPRNSDACSRYGSLCGYFDACSGRLSIDDHARYPRKRAHAELAAPTTTTP